MKHWISPICFLRTCWASSQARQPFISSSSFIGMLSGSRRSKQLHSTSIVSLHYFITQYPSTTVKSLSSYGTHFNLSNMWCNNCARRTPFNYRIIDFFNRKGHWRSRVWKQNCIDSHPTFWTTVLPPLPTPPQLWRNQGKDKTGVCKYEGMPDSQKR